MFDLDEQLRRWRLETEATLAFEPNEIDELEDHLKSALEKAVADGASPEHAWNAAIARVGASPSLALEFAKSKLMPALIHLVTSWWKPVVLLLLFVLLNTFAYDPDWLRTDRNVLFPGTEFWIVVWVSFAALFILIPGRTAKIAFLAGAGNAFCLIPILHLLVYNAIGERIIGPGWCGMGPTFGALPLLVSMLGFIVINAWAWSHIRADRSALPAFFAIAATIILVLALSPFVSALIGNLSIRDIFSMPTAHDITLTGQARTNFMTWKFDDVLINCIIIISTWLPLVLLAIVCAGTLGLQGIGQILRFGKPAVETTFPALRDLPWIMALAGNGVSWVMACFLVPVFSQQIGHAEANGFHAPGVHLSVACMTVVPALCFLICGYELTKRLQRTASLRYFYASMLVAGEAVVLASVTLLPVLTPSSPLGGRVYPSSEPEWLSAVLGLAVALLASRQVVLIGKRVRSHSTTISLWKFDGNDLVRFGALLGLILACSYLILMMVALVIAFESVAMISTMIAWGNSIKNPETNHFDPFHYNSVAATEHNPAPQLMFWITSGINYVSICLAIGLTIAIVLSGLEFIRFNTFRLYRARKAARMAPATLALNE